MLTAVFAPLIARPSWRQRQAPDDETGCEGARRFEASRGKTTDAGAERLLGAQAQRPRSQPQARTMKRAAAKVAVGTRRLRSVFRSCTTAAGILIIGLLASGLCVQASDLDPIATETGDSGSTTTQSPVTPTTELILDADGTIGVDPAAVAAANASQKLKPVNFTLVDELFESVLDEPEVVRRWRSMDGQLQSGMKSILKLLFPQIVAISQDAKVSGDCSGGILKWILSLRNLRSWAIKMLDATGKPTAGVFEGSLTMFGNYRQCLNIRAPDEDEIEITEQFEEYFRGQFCVLHLKPYMPRKPPFYNLNTTVESLLRKNYKYYEKTLYDELAEIAIAFNFIDIRMDLCVPSTCSVADIQRVADLLSKKLEMRAKVMRCDTAPKDTSFFHSIDQVTALWALAPLTLVLVSLVSSLLVASRLAGSLDPVARRLSFGAAFRSRSPTEAIISQPLGLGNKHLGGVQQLAPQSQGPKPVVLYGMRILFVLWFMVAHMTMELKYQYLRESLNLRNMLMTYWPFQIIINSAPLYESLILITAFTLGFSCLESKLRDLVAYAVDMFLRLLLPIITLISLTVITPLFAIESPVWRNFVEEQSLVCKSTGYLNLFFLQNLISYDKICLPNSWLLCVELQLTVLSIPLLLMLRRNFLTREDTFIIESASKSDSSTYYSRNVIGLFKSTVGILCLTLIGAGFAANFLTVLTYKLPPAWFYTFPEPADKNLYFGLYLTKTWTHLSVFLIGLLGGHLCRSTINLRSLGLAREKKSASQESMQQSSAPSGSMDSRSRLTTPKMELEASFDANASQIGLADRGIDLDDDNNNNSSGSQVKHDANVILMNSSIQRLKSRDSLGEYYTQSKLNGTSLLWTSVVSMSALIFSTFSWSTGYLPAPLISALFDCGSRLVWSLALVSIMTILCLDHVKRNENNNFWFTRALDHPSCIFIGKLSLMVFLLTPYVHNIVLAVAEQSLFPSLFIIFHVIVGNIVIIYATAFILVTLLPQIQRLSCSL